MKPLTDTESISLFAAITVVAIMFFAVVGNPFVQKKPTLAVSAEKALPTDIIFMDKNTDQTAATQLLAGATDAKGQLTKLIVQDTKVGEGDAVKAGDTVTVHYIGTLQDGQEFDNSLRRNQPLTFMVGKGTVIKGWDAGIVGMKKGGERVLVIPPSLAYGDRGIGVIPPQTTLLFSITLLEVTK
jgi:FKBP-type peptidyl-prolyl cis-trans isomerase